MIKMKFKIILWISLLSLIFVGCATLKPAPPQPEVFSLPPAKSGLLSETSARITETLGPDESAFMLLIPNDDALNWRLALIDHAVSSIDTQYFIWENNETARLLLDRLIKAADRGVRIRLLVDDLPLVADDRGIAALSNHPYFDIKLFNPGSVRDSTLGAIGEFLLYFKELNRRMHNKLFVVDNQIAIIGGRNIGNPYFGLSKKYNFRDLDALVAGAVVEELSEAFDEYWNSELAYPGVALADIENDNSIQEVRDFISQYIDESRKTLASYPLGPENWEEKFLQLPARMKKGEAHVIQDKPVLIGGEEHRLVDMLRYLAEPNHKELTIVTPYLIPVRTFLEDIAKLSSEGVKVTILTGSMGSNNHTVAHSHYKKYRRRILATGANLYEFKHDPSQQMRDLSDVSPVEASFISLHIKAVVGDRKRCFIGSLNIDPRAIEINTENGLYIESSGLGKELARQFDIMMAPENAWRVYLNEDNQLRWESSSGTVSSQPARSFGQRIADFFFRLLPIESQL
jgi:putative cardiolipin synthase